MKQVMTLKEVIADFKDKQIPQKLSDLLETPRQDVSEPIEVFLHFGEPGPGITTTAGAPVPAILKGTCVTATRT